MTDVTGDGDDYYIDGYGNAVPGKRPTKKAVKTYVDANGYVQELAEGENAPEKGGLISWLNDVDVANDPEVREALGEEALYFEHEISEGDARVLLVGTLGKNGWNVNVRSNSQGTEDFGFRLPKTLTKERAIAEAEKHCLEKLGPQFRQLSENELWMFERVAATNRLSAFVLFLQARLPDQLADRFLELGAAGNEFAIQQFAADEQISSIVEEACAYAFYWNNPRATGEFFDFVRARDENRLWTFALLDTLWRQYNVTSSIDRLGAEPPPTPEDFDKMNDEEIEKTLTEARRLRVRNQIR